MEIRSTVPEKERAAFQAGVQRRDRDAPWTTRRRVELSFSYDPQDAGELREIADRLAAITAEFERLHARAAPPAEPEPVVFNTNFALIYGGLGGAGGFAVGVIANEALALGRQSGNPWISTLALAGGIAGSVAGTLYGTGSASFEGSVLGITVKTERPGT